MSEMEQFSKDFYGFFFHLRPFIWPKRLQSLDINTYIPAMTHSCIKAGVMISHNFSSDRKQMPI